MKKFVKITLVSVFLTIMALVMTGCTEECPQATLEPWDGGEHIITEKVITETIYWENVQVESWN